MSSTSTSTVHTEVFELCSDNSSINEVASLQNTVNVTQLQQQLSGVLKDHQNMDDTFNQIAQVHTANLMESLDCNNKWSCRIHLIANAGKVLGLLLAFILYFASVADSLILVGQCIAIAAYFVDLCLQKVTVNKLSDIKFFGIQYELAKRTYTILLDSFNEYCDVLTEHYPECTGLKKEMDVIFQLKLTNTSLCSLKLVLQSIFTLIYSKDLANFIVLFLSGCTVKLNEFMIAIFQEVVNNVGAMSLLAVMVCNVYILLDTIVNFFEPCTASKDIVLYMVKLHNFQKDLSHVADTVKLDIQLLKCEVAKIMDKQKINLLKQQLECQKIDFAKETLAQNQTFNENLKSQKENFKHHMELLKQELQSELTLQQGCYDKLLNHQQKSLQDQLNMQFYQFKAIINDQQELIHKLTTKLANC